jgi:PD-(D/E)XK nuclease superfamily
MLTKFPEPFVPGTKVQYAWDSTSLTVAMACAQRYKYEILDGWQPKNPNVAIALSFGILLHAGIEAYHRLRTAGVDFDAAVVGSLRAVLTKEDFRKPGEPIIGQLPVHDDIAEMKAADDADDEADGIDLRNSKIRTRYHLFRALVWYFDNYRLDALKVITLSTGDAAVEHSFRVPVGESLSDGTPLLLSGHYDKLVDFNDQLYISDIKSTKSITMQWRQSFDLSHQMTGYVLGGKIGLDQPVQGAFIDGVCLQVGGVKFNRFVTTRSDSQLREYVRMLKYVADQAEMWFTTDYYPQNTAACMFCQYKEICRQPPEFRAGMLKTYFKQVPAWNPLAVR